MLNVDIYDNVYSKLWFIFRLLRIYQPWPAVFGA